MLRRFRISVRVLTAAMLIVVVVSGGTIPGYAVASEDATADSRAIVENQNDIRYESGMVSVAATPVFSGDYRIDALATTSRIVTAVGPSGRPMVTWSFYEDSVWSGAYFGTETGVHEVAEETKRNMRSIMAWYGSLVNIEFVEVTETPSVVGQIRLMLSDGPANEGFFAYAYFPGAAGTSVTSDIHLNPNYDGVGGSNDHRGGPGTHGYCSLVHEVGHALGLNHPFGHAQALPTPEDVRTRTVMSYTHRGACVSTPMSYDILALQYMYGSSAHNVGDDRYVMGGDQVTRYTVSGSGATPAEGSVGHTVWDSAGLDTIDASLLPSSWDGYRFDLRGGGFAATSLMVPNASGLEGWANRGTYFATSFAPENFVVSGSDDVVIANDAPNIMTGYRKGVAAGTDTYFLLDGADVLDLSEYREAEITKSRIGDDLKLDLGYGSAVVVDGYYTGSVPTIAYGAAAPIVLPSVYLTAPVASTSKPLARRTFTVSSQIGPRFTAGTVPARVYIFKRSTTGVYTLVKSVGMKAYSYSSTRSLLKASTSLTSRGIYRLQVMYGGTVRPANGRQYVKTYSSFRYITVR